MSSSPASVRDEAEFLYRFIESPRREIGLFDERDYFLGETALLAGNALPPPVPARGGVDLVRSCRGGFPPHDQRSCRAVAPGAISVSPNGWRSGSSTSCSRCCRRCSRASRSSACPRTRSSAGSSRGWRSWRRTSLRRRVAVFNEICAEAEALGIDRLLAERVREPDPRARNAGRGAGGDRGVRRGDSDPPASRRPDRPRQGPLGPRDPAAGDRPATPRPIDAYRKAQEDFEAIGMRADVAALNLVIADLLLEEGRNGEALREISAALPVISELKMAPEGMAALSLRPRVRPPPGSQPAGSARTPRLLRGAAELASSAAPREWRMIGLRRGRLAARSSFSRSCLRGLRRLLLHGLDATPARPSR